MSRRSWIARDLGVPILLSPYLPDGEVYYMSHPSQLGTSIVIGTRPRTAVEQAGYRGKWLAQQGLIDWLLYIGEKPIPKHQRTHEDVLTALHAHA